MVLKNVKLYKYARCFAKKSRKWIKKRPRKAQGIKKRKEGVS